MFNMSHKKISTQINKKKVFNCTSKLSMIYKKKKREGKLFQITILIDAISQFYYLNLVTLISSKLEKKKIEPGSRKFILFDLKQHSRIYSCYILVTKEKKFTFQIYHFSYCLWFSIKEMCLHMLGESITNPVFGDSEKPQFELINLLSLNHHRVVLRLDRVQIAFVPLILNYVIAMRDWCHP